MSEGTTELTHDPIPYLATELVEFKEPWLRLVLEGVITGATAGLVLALVTALLP